MSSFGDTNTGSNLIPTEIDFDNSDVERALRRPRLRADTVYHAKCTEAKRSAWPSGGLVLDLTFAPMTKEGTTRFPTATYRLDVPFTNPLRPEAQVAEPWKVHAFLTALYPERFPPNPTFNKDTGGFTTADGQQVDKVTAAAIKKQILTDVLNQVKAYWSTPNELVGEVAYVLTNNRDFRGIARVMAEPPAGVEVRYSEFADTDA